MRVPSAIYTTQRLLSRLLCALILISAVDRIPDPPSIKPHEVSISFGLGSHHVPVVNQDRGSHLVASNLSEQVQPFDSSLLADEKLLVASAIHLDQASDSSPPPSAS